MPEQSSPISVSRYVWPDRSNGLVHVRAGEAPRATLCGIRVSDSWLGGDSVVSATRFRGRCSNCFGYLDSEDERHLTSSAASQSSKEAGKVGQYFDARGRRE